MIYLAFYKHKVRVTNWRTFKERAIDEVIRLFTRSRYSHCEIAVARNDGKFTCYTSSPRDGGVRKKIMHLPSDKWDLVRVNVSANRVRSIFAKHVGKRYDLLGALFYPLGIHRKNKYFCSEYCAITLNYYNTLQSPQSLYEVAIADTQKSPNHQRG